MVKIILFTEPDELDKKLLASIRAGGKNGKRAYHIALELNQYPGTINSRLNMLQRAGFIRLVRGHNSLMAYSVEA